MHALAADAGRARRPAVVGGDRLLTDSEGLSNLGLRGLVDQATERSPGPRFRGKGHELRIRAYHRPSKLR